MPTVKELRAMAKARGLRGYSTLNKGPLEQLLGLATNVADAIVDAADTVATTVATTIGYTTQKPKSIYEIVSPGEVVRTRALASIGPYNPDAFDVKVHERATNYQLRLREFGYLEDEQDLIQRAEEFGRKTDLSQLPYDRKMLPFYALAYARLFYSGKNSPAEDAHMNKLFDIDAEYEKNSPSSGESLLEEEIKELRTALSQRENRRLVEQRRQRPDWAKFVDETGINISLNDYIDAENNAIEAYYTEFGDHPEFDNPRFLQYVRDFVDDAMWEEPV
jgi:hypothetical protein